jgi:hypothetical protein
MVGPSNLLVLLISGVTDALVIPVDVLILLVSKGINNTLVIPIDVDVGCQAGKLPSPVTPHTVLVRVFFAFIFGKVIILLVM